MTASLDDLIRAAFRDRTTDVPAPVEPDWNTAPRGRPSRRVWVVLPVMAVLAIVVAVAVVGGRDEPQGRPVTPVEPVATPTLAMRVSERKIEIVDVASGRVRGTVRLPERTTLPPSPGPASAAADNRTFFFTVLSASGHSVVARIHVDGQGRPGKASVVVRAPSTPDIGTVVPGLDASSTHQPALWGTADAVAVSPDATRLAMVAGTPRGDAIVLWDLGTGARRLWGTQADVLSLTWTTDGRRLRWASRRSTGTVDPGATRQAPPVDRPVGEGDRTPPALLPDGSHVAYVGGKAVRLMVLSPQGRPVRELGRWTDASGMRSRPTVDASGRHVLFIRNGAWERIDLATSQRSTTALRLTHIYDAHFYAW
ncbi:hypothetical protein [Spirillospora albida]|uniref:hypothetical protein n=1 Tax=Spirillospora albida TaxID=58123 RepID=UPI0004BFF040|nr:hypothetical protein [Spirillospora albida]